MSRAAPLKHHRDLSHFLCALQIKNELRFMAHTFVPTLKLSLVIAQLYFILTAAKHV